MRFRPCQCDGMSVARLPRSGWMRMLVPRLRYWVCTTCGSRFLASKARMAAAPKISADGGTTH